MKSERGLQHGDNSMMFSTCKIHDVKIILVINIVSIIVDEHI